MKKKKLLSVLTLAALMTLPAMAACQTIVPSVSTTSGETTSAPDSTSTPEPSTPAPTSTPTPSTPTPSTPAPSTPAPTSVVVKYFVTYGSGQGYTITGIKSTGYEAGATVSFKVVVDDPTEKEINTVKAGGETLVADATGTYSFEMPAKQVQISVSLKNVIKYAITVEGTLKADETVKFTLYRGTDPVSEDYKFEAKTDADKNYVDMLADGVSAKLIKEGKATVVAKVDNKVVAEKELDIGASAIMAIKDALDAAIKEAPCNGKAGNNSNKTTSDFTIAGKIVSISNGSKATATQIDETVIIDDGTGYVPLMVYGKPDNKAYQIGDAVKATVKFTNYYGLLEGIATVSTSTKQSSLYPDQLAIINKAFTTQSVATMNGEQFAEFYAQCKVNGADGGTEYTMPRFVEMDVTGNGTKLKLAGDTTSDAKGTIAGVGTNLCPQVDTTDGLPSKVKGYLIGCNTSSKQGTFHCIEQVKAKVNGVTIQEKAEGLEIYKNTTLQLHAVTTPAGAEVTSMVWTSSDDTIATVSQEGLVTGVAEGIVTIKVRVNDEFEDQVTIKINGAQNHCTSISFVNAEEKIALNESLRLELILAGELEDTPITDTVTWATSDDTVATVEGGVVTGLKEGEATITATCNEKSATVKVTVYNPYGTKEKPLTVEEALELIPEETDAFTEEKAYVKGIATVAKWSSKYNNYELTIKSTTGEATIGGYAVGVAEDVTFAQGDEIVVYGYLQNYKGNTPQVTQFKNSDGSYDRPSILSATHLDYVVTFVTPENGTFGVITGLTIAEEIYTGKSGDEFTFKAVPAEGYKVKAVKVNDVAVDAEDDVYKVVVTGNMNVTAEFVSVSVQVTSKTLSFAQSSYTNQDDKISSYEKSWQKDGFTISNANNNNQQWDYIKIGKKNLAQTATITNNNPFEFDVNTISVVISKVYLSNQIDFNVKVYSDKELTQLVDTYVGGKITDAKTYVATPNEGKTWEAGCYIVIEFVVPSSDTTNGFIWIDSVTFDS